MGKKKSGIKASKNLTAKKTGKHSRAKMLAKKKAGAKVFAKNNNRKNYRLAERNGLERNKG